MLAAIRLRGAIKVRKETEDTLRMLGLKKVNALSVLKDDPRIIGMIRKVEDFVTWGTLSEEVMQTIGSQTVLGLKPPKGGLKSIKKHYPKGDLGYRGDAINILIKKMLIH